MPLCLIGLGSNLGDSDDLLDRALSLLADRNLRAEQVSAFRSTLPVGGPPGQACYVNGVAVARSTLPALDVLSLLQSVELELGRTRDERWGPRTIDLDLLLYGSAVIREVDLTVPHPRMAVRRFVIEPAAEIVPQMVHPTIGWTLAQIAAHLSDPSGAFQIVATHPEVRRQIVEVWLPQWSEWLCEAGEPATGPWPTGMATCCHCRLAGQTPGFRPVARLAPRFPKVSVVIDPPLAVLRDWMAVWRAASGVAAAAEWTSTDLERAQQALGKRLASAGNGPFIHIDAVEWKTVVAEVRATLEAVFPGLGSTGRAGIE